MATIHEYTAQDPEAAANWLCQRFPYTRCIPGEQPSDGVALNLGGLESKLVLKSDGVKRPNLLIETKGHKEKIVKDLELIVGMIGDSYTAPGGLIITVLS